MPLVPVKRLVSRCSPAFFLPVLMLFVGLSSFARGEEAEVLHMTMQCVEPTECWAFDPKSKRVFGSTRTKILEYSHLTGAQIGQFQLRSFFEHMVLNNDKLFVSTSHGLQVIDLKTNTVGKIISNLDNIRSLAVASTTSPHVYLFASPIDGSHGVDFVVIDAQTLKILHRTNWEKNVRQPVPNYFAVSQDGLTFANFGHINLKLRAHKGVCSRIIPPDFEIQRVADFEIAAVPLAQTELSRQWLAGSELMSSDLQTRLGEYPGDCTAFAESWDRFASLAISDRETNPPDMIMWVGRVSDGEELLQFDMPANSREHSTRELNLAMPKVEFDEKCEFVFCSYGRGAHVVDIRNLAKPADPSALMLSMPEKRRYPAGSNIQIKLEPTSSNPSSKLSVELAGGPDGMKLEGSTISWKPGFDQLGLHELIIAAKNGSENRKFKFALEIVVPEIVLGISAQSIVHDPAGRYLAVFGRKAEEEHDYSSFHRVPPTHLEIVDLDSMKVVGAHEVDGWPRAKVFIGNKLFWVPKAVNKLLSVDVEPDSKVETLETPLDNIEGIVGLDHGLLVKVIKLGSTPEGLASVDGFTMPIKPENRAIVHDSDTWEIIEDHPLSKIAWPGHSGAMRDAYEIGDSQLHLFGKIIDEKDGTVICYNSRILGPGQQLVRVEERDFIAMINGADGYAWGRRYSSQELKKVGSDEPLISFPSDYSPSSPMHLSRQVPYFLSLAPVDRRENPQYSMQLFELVYGKLLGDYPLPAHITFRPGHPRGFSFARIVGNRLVAIVGDRFVTYEMPEFKHQLEPLRLLYPQLPPVLIDEPFKCQLTAKGGKAPYKFSTAKQVPGIEIDADSGQLTVNYPRLWKLYLGAVGAGLRREVIYTENLEGSNGLFEHRFGVKLPAGRVPISVQTVLEVRDASGQSDQILVSTIAFAPIEPLEVEISKAKQVFERQRLQQLQQQQQRQRLLPKPNNQPPVQL